MAIICNSFMQSNLKIIIFKKNKQNPSRNKRNHTLQQYPNTPLTFYSPTKCFSLPNDDRPLDPNPPHKIKSSPHPEKKKKKRNFNRLSPIFHSLTVYTIRREGDVVVVVELPHAPRGLAAVDAAPVLLRLPPRTSQDFQQPLFCKAV